MRGSSARGVLSDLKKTLEQSGMGGAELIAEEEKKLEAQEKAYKRSVKEAEKQKKAEEAEAERRRQRSAAQLKTEANALFSAGKVRQCCLSAPRVRTTRPHHAPASSAMPHASAPRAMPHLCLRTLHRRGALHC